MNDAELNSVRSKIARYCAYRERAIKEVVNKLESLNIDQHHIDLLIEELIEEGYLDNNRFAKIYAGSKFRLKKWGKLKIKRELRLKEINEEDIQSGLSEIEGQNYLETLQNLAEQKFNSLKKYDLFIRKNKVASYLVSKGYESDLVWEVINKLS